MTEVELLTRQTENAYEWANKLIESVPLTMSHYFHGLQSAWVLQWKFGVGHWTFDIESDRRHYLTTKKDKYDLTT